MFNDSEDKRLFNTVAFGSSLPAFARRARDVEAALEALLAGIRQQRSKLAQGPARRCAALRARAGDWQALRPWLANDEQVAVLQLLERDLASEPIRWLEKTARRKVLQSALHDLVTSLISFNERWPHWLSKVDLTLVNDRRAAYNRYYVLEKECALGATLARRGFTSLPPLTPKELADAFPLLAVPNLVIGLGRTTIA